MKPSIVFLCTVGLILLAGGCEKKVNGSGSGSPPTGPDKQAQIKTIQNNPHLTAKMKADIIKQINAKPQAVQPGTPKK